MTSPLPGDWFLAAHLPKDEGKISVKVMPVVGVQILNTKVATNLIQNTAISHYNILCSHTLLSGISGGFFVFIFGDLSQTAS